MNSIGAGFNPPMPSTIRIRNAMANLIRGRDLDTLSIGGLRRELENHFSLRPGTLDSMREEIKKMAHAQVLALSSAAAGPRPPVSQPPAVPFTPAKTRFAQTPAAPGMWATPPTSQPTPAASATPAKRKRAQTPYDAFRACHSRELSREFAQTTHHKEVFGKVAKTLSERWRSMSAAEKDQYAQVHPVPVGPDSKAVSSPAVSWTAAPPASVRTAPPSLPAQGTSLAASSAPATVAAVPPAASPSPASSGIPSAVPAPVPQQVDLLGSLAAPRTTSAAIGPLTRAQFLKAARNLHCVLEYKQGCTSLETAASPGTAASDRQKPMLDVDLAPRVYSTGSVGWFVRHSQSMQVAGHELDLQVQVTITVGGSKRWADGGELTQAQGPRNDTAADAPMALAPPTASVQGVPAAAALIAASEGATAVSSDALPAAPRNLPNCGVSASAVPGAGAGGSGTGAVQAEAGCATGEGAADVAAAMVAASAQPASSCEAREAVTAVDVPLEPPPDAKAESKGQSLLVEVSSSQEVEITGSDAGSPPTLEDAKGGNGPMVASNRSAEEGTSTSQPMQVEAQSTEGGLTESVPSCGKLDDEMRPMQAVCEAADSQSMDGEAASEDVVVDQPPSDPSEELMQDETGSAPMPEEPSDVGITDADDATDAMQQEPPLDVAQEVSMDDLDQVGGMQIELLMEGKAVFPTFNQGNQGEAAMACQQEGTINSAEDPMAADDAEMELSREVVSAAEHVTWMQEGAEVLCAEDEATTAAVLLPETSHLSVLDDPQMVVEKQSSGVLGSAEEQAEQDAPESQRSQDEQAQLVATPSEVGEARASVVSAEVASEGAAAAVDSA